MAGFMEVRFDGVEGLLTALREMEPKAARKVTRQGLRAGANLVKREAQALAPVASGATRKSIKARAGKRRKNVYSINAFAGGERFFHGDTFYAGFVEYGFQHRGGGRVEEQPFIRPAYDNNEEQIAREIEDALWGGVNDAWMGRL